MTDDVIEACDTWIRYKTKQFQEEYFDECEYILNKYNIGYWKINSQISPILYHIAKSIEDALVKEVMNDA